MSYMRHVACYGTVKILSDVCPECERTAFILDGRFACCGIVAGGSLPEAYKRKCEASNPRAQPSAQAKKEIMAAQEGRCFYCELEIGTHVLRVINKKGTIKRIKLMLHWDHLVPYAWMNANEDHNFVAACHVCNLIKGSMMFQTVEEARVYVCTQRERKGYL